jgi:tetratricopeptide (TPR) repeat protein
VAGRALDHASLVGQALGHYRIVDKIGAGGMGVVYRAHDEHLDREVAIKLLPPGALTDEDARKRFRKEARSLSKLNHPNIATVHDFDSQGDVDYLVMEYVPGKTLRDRISGGPLPEAETIRLAIQLAKGLMAAHERALVHRDLKPENVRFTLQGRVKILDFGLAKLIRPLTDSRTTESTISVVAGTLPYMSPEQVLGGVVDQRSDLFSFGVLLYEMATGQRPLSGVEPSHLIAAILRRPPVPPTKLNPKVSPHLERIIFKCLEKKPENRYQSAKELTVDLRRTALTSSATHGAWTARLRKGWAMQTAATALGLGVILAVAALLFHSRRVDALTPSDTIVLADFINSTPDPVFDDALKLALAADLEQSPFLNVVSDKKVGNALHLMGRAPGERITAQVAQEICLRIGSKAVLVGSIGSLGSHYVIGLRALKCQSGDSLGTAQAEADSREKVLQALDRAATALRKKLGESLASIQKFDKPLVEVTTSSLEALQAYTAGTKVYASAGNSAVPLLQHAIELDPNFAMAYASLGIAYNSMGQASLAIANFKKAYELSGRVSEREKLYIAAEYFTYVTGEVDKAIQQYQLWIQEYPQDATAHVNLALDYAIVGQYEKAAAGSKEGNRIDPTLEGYVNLGGYYIFLNRLDEAKATFEEAAAHKLEHSYLRLVQYYLAFAQNDDRGMQAQVAGAMGTPLGEDLLLSTASDTEGFYGRLRKARDLSRQAVESAKRTGAGEAAGLWQVNAALREAEFGNITEARRQIGIALAFSSGHDVELLAALALARSGESARAQAIIQKMSNESPQSTVLQGYWAPVIRAEIELSSGSAAKAIQILEAARPYELGEPPPFQPATMYPIYVRGQAYLTVHQGKDAAAEFQKILDRKTIVLNFPLGALAQLGLARAYAMQGDTVKARTGYEGFLTVWRNADPDIPLLKQAKVEYAKLQ